FEQFPVKRFFPLRQSGDWHVRRIADHEAILLQRRGQEIAVAYFDAGVAAVRRAGLRGKIRI
ncbi:MAG: hypothetical protein WAN81_02150, partial [Candidatus Binataceae bacterium]